MWICAGLRLRTYTGLVNRNRRQGITTSLRLCFYVGKFRYELTVANFGKRDGVVTTQPIQGVRLKRYPLYWNSIIFVNGVYKTLQNLPVTIFIHIFAAVINE